MAKDLGRLTAEERTPLTALLSTGRRAASVVTRARMLRNAEARAGGPTGSAQARAEAVATRLARLHRVRQACVAAGGAAARARPRPTGRPERTWDGAPEARLVALTGRAPPEGRVRWTRPWLAARLGALAVVETMGRAWGRTPRNTTPARRGSRRRGSCRPTPTPRVSGPWRTSWTSTPAPTTRNGPWGVGRRRARHGWRQRGGRVPPPPGSGRASMRRLRGKARPSCAWSARLGQGNGG